VKQTKTVKFYNKQNILFACNVVFQTTIIGIMLLCDTTVIYNTLPTFKLKNTDGGRTKN